MSTPVKLEEIILGLESQDDDSRSYLNRKTGGVETIGIEELSAAENDEPLENYPEWQRESIQLAGEILDSQDWIKLPDKEEISEYSIMERFCLTIHNERVRETMYHAIKGSGAFRRFKDSIRQHGIEDDWYKFRDDSLRTLAIEWCKENEIAFVE